MGVNKYLKDIIKLFEKSAVVDYHSIERIVRSKGNVKYYAKRLVYELVKKGKIYRICKGRYSNKENISLFVFCFQPAYFGLQDALSAHGLWEQETIPVILTTRKIRSGIRKVFGSNILVRRISKRYFFGICYKEHEGIAPPYSDIEKTFIDMVYFRESLSDELIKIFRKKIDKTKLNTYLRNYPERIKKKIISYQ